MRKYRTSEQWQVLVDQQRASGLSAPQFCKRQSIAYASFCKWRKRLSEEPVADASCASDAGESSFLDLSSLMGAPSSIVPGWHIVLSLGNGVELRLSQNG